MQRHLLLLPALVLTVMLWLHAGLYQSGGNGQKYDISSEIVGRVLFTGSMAGLDRDLAVRYGQGFTLERDGFATATTDERPLYFIYLALLKQVSPTPVALHFALNLVLLLAAVHLLGGVFAPDSRARFLCLGALFLPPFFVNQSFVFEPHVPETFLMALALWLLSRGRVTACFTLAALSVGFHPGNLPLVGSLGLYHLVRDGNWRRVSGWALPGLGVCLGFGTITAYEALLFARDASAMLPHHHLLALLTTSSTRTSGNVAHAPGLLNFLRNAFLLMPLATAAIFWQRDRKDFFLVLLPLLLYLPLTRWNMPGAHRVLLPVFFLAQGLFIARCLSLKRGRLRTACHIFMATALAGSLAYYAVTARCTDLRFGSAVAMDPATWDVLPPAPARLHWNLSRYAAVVPDAPVVVGLRQESLLERPTISDPHAIYPYLVATALDSILPGSLARRLGADPEKTQGLGLTVTRRGHDAP